MIFNLEITQKPQNSFYTNAEIYVARDGSEEKQVYYIIYFQKISISFVFVFYLIWACDVQMTFIRYEGSSSNITFRWHFTVGSMSESFSMYIRAHIYCYNITIRKKSK